MSIIRALYIVSIASHGPREEILGEFHQALGDILEGVPLSQLSLKHISRHKVKDEVAWLRDHKD